MRHWSQLATRNWQAKRIRTIGALLAIALGTGAVVWVNCCYESVQQTMLGWAVGWIGRSHISIESPLGKRGVFPLRQVQDIAALDEVRHFAPLLVQRLRGRPLRRDDYDAGRSYDPWRSPSIDYHGIDLDTEFLVRDRPIVAGRMLTPADEFACVLEADYAGEVGVGLGDYLLIWNASGDTRHAFEIVGLTDRRRIARFQPPLALVRLPVLQQITNNFGFISAADVVLRDGEHATVSAAASRIRHILRRQNVQAHARSAEARMQQVALAQQQQEIVLALLSSVAMLTALFIILSTLSMGMLERISQLGLLRCVGITGGQLALLVFLEVIPLGLLGIVLGVPLGLALTAFSVWLVPEYVGQFAISWRGIGMAIAAGLATVLVAAALPAAAALRVSPLEASRPRARRPARWPLVLAFLLAGVLLIAQTLILTFKVSRDLAFVHWSSLAVVLLYLVYALSAPLCIWLLGSPAVMLVARLVRVRSRLLQDQVGYAVWRSTGICCGLMVGLSLIVALFVLNSSFRAGWQFPSHFPAAYIWKDDHFDLPFEETQRRVARVPGVANFTVGNALNVVVEENPRSPLARAMHSITWFLGSDPDTLFDLIRFEFIEGDEATARKLLNDPDAAYILIAADFARSRRKGLHPDEKRGISNYVNVWFGDRGWRQFQVAGVIDSPALDVAAGYFQVQSEARVAAMGSVIGAQHQLKRLFNIDSASLVLLNFDLPLEPVPPDWPPPQDTPTGRRLPAYCHDARIPLENRWQRLREDRVLGDVCRQLEAPVTRSGTVRELKDEIDAELTRLTYLLTAVPAVALLVAAIGVANLMTANVTSRMKPLAILRAVGATRGQILRMVIGEAVVLGALGSALGIALGLHLAWNVTTMTARFSGFATAVQIPWPLTSAAIALTVGLCVLAGILPARHASRANVIDALHVT